MPTSRNVIIIGSGPAGLTAALYTARANLQPLLIEGLEAGGQLMLTTLVENFPGHRDGIMGPDLMAEMRAQAEKFGAEIIQGNVDRGGLLRAAVRRHDVGRRVSRADASSSRPARRRGCSGLPSERTLMGHGVSTCATCDGYFFRGHEIAVVGGGDSAMEEAVFLTKFASKVTVVHRRDTLRASKIMQDKARANPKIAWLLNTEVDEIKDTGKGEVTAMVVRHAATGERKEVPVAGVFVAIGHTPNTSLFKGQLEMDANGYLVTHDGAEDERARRVRVRRRPGSHLPAGDHRGRLRLHGRARRRALPRTHVRSARSKPGRNALATKTRRLTKIFVQESFVSFVSS